MKTFTLEDQEALFIINQIGGLANNTGTAPLFAKLADQYNAQLPAPAVEAPAPTEEETPQ
jgi:hypothetical protein